MKKPIVSVALVAALILAGCTDGDRPIETGDPLLVPCPSGVASNLICTGNEQALTISGRARGVGDGAAIRVTMYAGHLDSLTLADLELVDYDEAIVITDILGCVCNLTVQNVTLTSAREPGLVGLKVILGSGGGSVTSESASDSFGLHFRGLRVAGFEQAISIDSISAASAIENLDVDCAKSGLAFSGGPLDISNSSFSDCSQIAVDAHSAASLVVSATFFDGNGVGLWMYGHRDERPIVRESVFRANGAGIVGSLRTDTGPLLPCQSRDLSVQNVTFVENGRSSEWLVSSGIRPGAILVGASGATIVGSSFEGNAGPAVGAVGVDGAAPAAPVTCYISATTNWWGSPLGPSRGIDERSIGLGDVVDLGTEVDPFLTSPP